MLSPMQAMGLGMRGDPLLVLSRQGWGSLSQAMVSSSGQLQGCSWPWLDHGTSSPAAQEPWLHWDGRNCSEPSHPSPAVPAPLSIPILQPPALGYKAEH